MTSGGDTVLDIGDEPFVVHLPRNRSSVGIDDILGVHEGNGFRKVLGKFANTVEPTTTQISRCGVEWFGLANQNIKILTPRGMNPESFNSPLLSNITMMPRKRSPEGERSQMSRGH